MVFAGMLRYRLSPDVYSYLARLDVEVALWSSRSYSFTLYVLLTENQEQGAIILNIVMFTGLNVTIRKPIVSFRSCCKLQPFNQ